MKNYSAAALSDEVPLFNQFPIADFERENRRSSNRSVYRQFSLLRRDQSRTREYFNYSESTKFEPPSYKDPASKEPQTSTITFRCSDALYAVLTQEAKSRNQSLSEVIRSLISKIANEGTSSNLEQRTSYAATRCFALCLPRK